MDRPINIGPQHGDQPPGARHRTQPGRLGADSRPQPLHEPEVRQVADPVLCVAIDESRAARPLRLRLVMDEPRRRLVVDLPAGAGEARLQIDLLEINGKVARIEQPDLGECRTPQRQRRAGHIRPFARRVPLAVVDLPHPMVAGVAVGIEQAARVLDRAAVGVEQLAADRADGRVARERGAQRVDPVGRDLGVVVEQDQDLAARGQHPGVVPAGEPQIAPGLDQPRLGKVAPDERGRGVGRPVIDDDDLVRRPPRAARPQRPQTRRQHPLAVERADNDAAQGRGFSLAHRETCRCERMVCNSGQLPNIRRHLKDWLRFAPLVTVRPDRKRVRYGPFPASGEQPSVSPHPSQAIPRSVTSRANVLAT
ncbi:MAG: hypothetical protein BWZ08_02811 [candidate division BRC1 bacterium ADurb.BinA292]|nr:MAG: hypothetical protein BWZ08_02811 [candidate division BRC1 bacterium ADurb.BinA292]